MKTLIAMLVVCVPLISLSAEKSFDQKMADEINRYAMGVGIGFGVGHLDSKIHTQLRNGWEKEYEPWMPEDIREDNGCNDGTLDVYFEFLRSVFDKNIFIGAEVRYCIDLNESYSKNQIGGIVGFWWDDVWLKPITLTRDPFQYGPVIYYVRPFPKDSVFDEVCYYVGLRALFIDYSIESADTRGVDVWGGKNYSIPINKNKIEDGMGYKLELAIGVSMGVELFVYADQYGKDVNSMGLGFRGSTFTFIPGVNVKR